jgi:hypothetical protein
VDNFRIDIRSPVTNDVGCENFAMQHGVCCLAALKSRKIELSAGLLPSAAERLVELNQALKFVVARLRQSKFRIEERPLAIQHLKVI